MESHCNRANALSYASHAGNFTRAGSEVFFSIYSIKIKYQRVAQGKLGKLNAAGDRHSVTQASTSGTYAPLMDKSEACHRHSVTQTSTSGTGAEGLRQESAGAAIQ